MLVHTWRLLIFKLLFIALAREPLQKGANAVFELWDSVHK